MTLWLPVFLVRSLAKVPCGSSDKVPVTSCIAFGDDDKRAFDESTYYSSLGYTHV